MISVIAPRLQKVMESIFQRFFPCRFGLSFTMIAVVPLERSDAKSFCDHSAMKSMIV